MIREPEISLRSYGGDVQQHRHEFHQFVLPLRGTLELDTHAGARRVDAATALLIPAGERHCFHARGENRFAVVDLFEDHPLCDRAAREPALAAPPTLHCQLEQLRIRLAGGDLSPQFRHHWTALLLDTLEGEGVPATDAGARRFAAAVGRIRQGEVMSVDALAHAVGSSRSRLHALFRHHAGTTPGEYMMRVRLEQGASALVAGDRSIADIALDCGFSEHSAFTRAFGRVYGTSPSEYRRRNRSSRHRGFVGGESLPATSSRPGGGPCRGDTRGS